MRTHTITLTDDELKLVVDGLDFVKAPDLFARLKALLPEPPPEPVDEDEDYFVTMEKTWKHRR